MSFSLPKTWKNCLTCRKWAGSRHPKDPWCNYIECESTSTRGKCYGGGFNMADMTANASCSSWEAQYE